MPNGPITHRATREAPATAQAFDGAGQAPRTVDAYTRAFGAFCAWSRGAGNVEPFPATPEAVIAYLTHMAATGRKAPTIALHAAAIACAHRAAGHEPPTNREAVRETVSDLKRAVGTPPDRKAPLTSDALRRIVGRIPEDLIGMRDRALLLIGFTAALRRSELVTLRVEDLERTPAGLVIHSAPKAAGHSDAGHVAAVPARSKLRPVQALDAWLRAAEIAEGPVFRSIAKGGRLSPNALTDRSASQIVKDRAAAAGLDPALYSIHSLRAGFVASALATGASPLDITHVIRHARLEMSAADSRRTLAFENHAGKDFL